MTVYRYILILDLVPLMSSFSRKKVMDAYRKEKERWKNERDFQVLNNTAFHFFHMGRWRVVQVIADKLI